MYLRPIFLLMFAAFLHLEVNAQFLQPIPSNSEKSEITFSFIPQQLVLEEAKIGNYQISNNRFLVSTGFLLQGLKFNSPVDEFNAVAPFDIRAYEPKSFSELNNKISSNLLITNHQRTIFP